MTVRLRRWSAWSARQALEIEFLKGGAFSKDGRREARLVRDRRPRVFRRSRMPADGIARSTDYGARPADRDVESLALIEVICAEFEAYGYRRVTAELRHQGHLVDSKRCDG